MKLAGLHFARYPRIKRELTGVCRSTQRKRGFTLLELLIVISIIAILVALLLPAVQQARESARRTACLNNLRQFGLALHNYHEMYQTFPPGYVYRPGPTGNEAGFGWGAMLLPLLEQRPLYQEFDWNSPLWAPANAKPRMEHLSVFLCPSDPVSYEGFVQMDATPIEKYAMSSFVACFGPPDLDDTQEARDGMFSRNSSTKARDVSDGLSTTLAVGERVNGPFRLGIPHGVHFNYETTWCGAIRQFDDPTDDHGHMVLFQTGHTPNDPHSDDRDVSAPHAGFAQFLMADGSSRTISERVDFSLYQALGTVAGNEVVNDY